MKVAAKKKTEHRVHEGGKGTFQKESPQKHWKRPESKEKVQGGGTTSGTIAKRKTALFQNLREEEGKKSWVGCPKTPTDTSLENTIPGAGGLSALRKKKKKLQPGATKGKVWGLHKTRGTSTGGECKKSSR